MTRPMFIAMYSANLLHSVFCASISGHVLYCISEFI